MHFSKVLLTALASTATATFLPLPGLQSPNGWLGWGNCLSDSSAADFVKQFIKTLQISGSDAAGFDAALKAVANPKVQEISDSVNFLAGKPYGSVSLDGYAGFEAFHATSPPGGVYKVETLNIWHTCNVITWRWLFTLYPGAQPIRGINVFVLGQNGKVDVLYDEFNVAAWAEDLGYTITPPAGPPPS